jgi:uncharacterized protein (DUF2062 family)
MTSFFIALGLWLLSVGAPLLSLWQPDLAAHVVGAVLSVAFFGLLYVFVCDFRGEL